MKKKLQSVFEEMLWIPEYLSRGVHSLQKISMEQDDIKQELRMALWLSLRKYVSLIKEGSGISDGVCTITSESS